jgi:hypothetical protein
MHAIATAVTAVVMRIAQTRFTAGELYSWDADTTAVTFRWHVRLDRGEDS